MSTVRSFKLVWCTGTVSLHIRAGRILSVHTHFTTRKSLVELFLHVCVQYRCCMSDRIFLDLEKKNTLYPISAVVTRSPKL